MQSNALLVECIQMLSAFRSACFYVKQSVLSALCVVWVRIPSDEPCSFRRVYRYRPLRQRFVTRFVERKCSLFSTSSSPSPLSSLIVYWARQGVGGRRQRRRRRASSTTTFPLPTGCSVRISEALSLGCACCTCVSRGPLASQARWFRDPLACQARWL